MPTAARIGRYRFFFYSAARNEPPHVHVEAGEDSAKFWLDPIRLQWNDGFNSRHLNEVERLIVENRVGFLEKWYEHLGS